MKRSVKYTHMCLTLVLHAIKLSMRLNISSYIRKLLNYENKLMHKIICFDSSFSETELCQMIAQYR